ncbi:MAG: hypothetical protein V1861_03800 [Candidatus Micrarchaeota archaeon]
MNSDTSKKKKVCPTQTVIARTERAIVAPIKSSLLQALAEGPAGQVSANRTHNGLPVISTEEYARNYNTQSTDSEVRIFDFRGYVEGADGSLRFRDVTTLNGLRGGIHVGINGTTDYWDGSHSVRGPEDLGEFVMYVLVPSATQKKEGVMVSCDSCYNADEYRRNRAQLSSDECLSEEIALAQSKDGYIVTRLYIDPQEPGARDGIRILSLAISEYIKRGYPLDGLTNFVYAAEERILASGGSGKIPTIEELCPR